jgi:hypothetical protein
MNKNIKSLFLKDLFLFKNYKKTYIFTTLVFAIILFSRAIYGDVTYVGTLLFMLVFGTNSISTFSYDEMAKTERYLIGLTIKRKEMVRAKYLFSIFVSLFATLVGMIISFLATIIMFGEIPNLYFYFLFVLYAYLAISFLITTDVPCIYKWGTEKGRMQAIIIPIILTMILMLIGMVIYAILKYYAIFDRQAILKFLHTFAYPIPIILIIVMYYISYRISLKIFIKKDL